MDIENLKTGFVMILGMTALESGLTREQLQTLLKELQPGREYLPIQFFENNTAAYGFICRDYYESCNYDNEILETAVAPILDDSSLEKEGGVYALPKGEKFKMFYI